MSSMRKKQFFLFASAFILLAIVAVLAPYFIHFGSLTVSKNFEEWNRFASYIGNLLNPIFTFLNILCFVVLTYSLFESGKKKDEDSERRRIKPIIYLSYEVSQMKVEISLTNVGLGSAIISHISLVDAKGNDTGHFGTHLRSILRGNPINLTWEVSTFHNGRIFLKNESDSKLMSIESSEMDFVKWQGAKNKIINYLKAYKVRIVYSDINGESKIQDDLIPFEYFDHSPFGPASSH